tara:strand:- start:202 stop:396 length:195 start_codon:yes stop_codon:yes gene_type:complete
MDLVQNVRRVEFKILMTHQIMSAHLVLIIHTEVIVWIVVNLVLKGKSLIEVKQTVSGLGLYYIL